MEFEEEEEVVNSFLTFKVNGGIYGVHVSKVVEILAYEQPKASAGAMPYMLGLISHRGRILPLIDSGAKFDTGSVNITDQTYVIVISVDNNGEQFDVALAVDEVREVIDIPDDVRKNIENSYKPGYISFAAPTDGGLALIIDPDHVFTDTDVVSMSKIIVEQN